MILILCVVLLASSSGADVLMRGVPIFRCETSWKGTANCKHLDSEEVEKFKTAILGVNTPNGLQFAWQEDGRTLKLRRGGKFDSFNGEGMYIKVWRYKEFLEQMGDLAQEPPDFLPEPTPKYLYMEHTQMFLTTITYFGVATEYWLDESMK